MRVLFCFLVLVGCGGPADPDSDAGMDARGSDVFVGPDALADAMADAAASDARSADASQSDVGDLEDAGADASPDVPVPAECGNGDVEAGEECDDGNRDAGDACSPDCRNAWACPPLGDSCDGARPATVEHRIAEADGCSFALAPWTTARVAERRVLIDALAMSARNSGDLLSVDERLNRDGRSGISTRNSDRLRNHEWEGFRWNTGDENVSYWYP
ncbi:MAG: hypothetical protein AB8H86_19905, partial [Polyangiales bacterium]